MRVSKKKSGKNKIFVLILFIVLSAALITIDSVAGGGIRPGYESLLSFLSYPQRAVVYSLRGGRDFFKGIFAQRHLVRRNRELEWRVNFLEESLAEIEGYSRENVQLRELLDFRSSPGFEEIFRGSMGAEVIGRNPNNWYRTVILDRGEKDGVRKGMVVVGVGGLAGRIVGIGDSASTAMLALDMDSRVSAVVERTGEHGIITGRGDGVLIMNYLSDKSEVKSGDVVRTSGLGGIFPKGLSVGTITGVSSRDYGLTISAEVAPAVDFTRLETVLILRN